MSRYRCDAVVDQGRRDFFFRGAAAATILAASGAATPVRAEATDKQKEFMAEANRLAVESVKKGWGGPFGAVIVRTGKIIAEAANCVTQFNDPTAHAEVTAIRKACRKLRKFELSDCEIYTSCEPCPMCLGAIYWARPERVYYAATASDAAAAGFDDSFIYAELKISRGERKIPFIQGMHDAGLEPFREWLRKGDRVNY